jgi:hypothetical protein
MQEHVARQVRESWGDRPCPHPALDRRYYGASQDGYVCIRCGAKFTTEERDRILAAKLLPKAS